ncbi:hypothetical protein ACGF12_05750 [Kitasatospora sp. NPDC048296]|uniref:hypothetical protein n=1 Tax=Kitasatospora sp. NPDC048296 TaxID=3364048 RepID=UPI00371ADD1A
MSAAPIRRTPPPMPGRTPRGLREAIATHTPELLPEFEDEWKRFVADTYNVAPVPAFVTRWWERFALARDAELNAHVRDLLERAAGAKSHAEAMALMEQVSEIKYSLRGLEPGE